jgi:hypothetical protein
VGRSVFPQGVGGEASSRGLLLAAAASAAASAAAFSLAGGASRRAADAPYALWTVAHNAAVLLACLGAERAAPGPLPALLRALAGRHTMLLTFLAANVMTVRARVIWRANGENDHECRVW